MAGKLLIIDEELRFILFGLECILNISFSGKIIEQIFIDSEEDQVNEKHYTLLENKKESVICKVDEYEPESVWLSVNSSKIPQKRLDEISENAKYAVHRLKEHNEKCR